MPEYPVLSGAQVVRAFEQLGFHSARQKGSHVVMRRESQGCVVPLHRELKRGTLAGIVRQSGVSAEDFLAAID